MPELLPQPGPLVTTQAPTPGVSPGEIAQPYQEFSKTLQDAGDVMSEISVRAAKQAAAQDLTNQKVTRDADGNISVESPSSAPLLFGPAGAAYEQAMAAGTVANVSNAVSQRLNELHQKFPADPAGYKSASDNFLAGLDLSRLSPQVHQAIQREGQQLQTQHLNSITDQAGSISVEAQKNAIVTNQAALKSTAIGLVRQQGENGPEFRETLARLDKSYEALATNPLFQTSPDQIAIEQKQTHALMHGEAVVAATDDTFNKQGKAAAQQLLESSILKNPDLSESDRSRLYSTGMARLQFLTGDAKATVDANRTITAEMEKSLADRKLSPSDPTIGMAIDRARSIGDFESAQRLTAAAAVATHLRGVEMLPDAARDQVMGTGGRDVANQSIPPEGRALLRTIGATESGGRYDLRYGPNGGVAFGSFADHPNIAEPITSGPDAGNVSTAAGYYQFTAATWREEAGKLGLKDFSPANQDSAAWDLAQTEYKAKTGKDLLTVLRSGDTSDVLPSLSGRWSSLPGGRQPAQRYLAPSLNGGPGFTAEDVQRNPYLLSAYVRSLASDPEWRIQSARQTADAVTKTINNNMMPAAAAVAEVNQAAALYPDKLGAVADAMNGKIRGQLIAALPADQREATLEAFRAATAGPDVHQVNIANAALEQVTRQQQNMRDHPLTEAAARGWTESPAPFDPARPDTIAPALAQRAVQSARIASLNNSPAPPLLDKDELPALQSVLQGPAGPKVLASIGATLKPDQMQTLLQQEQVRTTIAGMSRSGDPAKMNAAYSFMDGLQKRNPLQFDQQFPNSLADLRAWQSNLSFYPSAQAAARLMQTYDPAQSAARKASDEVADQALKSVPASKVIAKFSTGWGPVGTAAGAPVSAQAGVAAGALKSDYDLNYKEGFARTGDATSADNFAMEKLGLKYSLSPTNGNRVTAYAPERYYPAIGGSYGWMGRQLDEAIAKQLDVAQRPLYGTVEGVVEPEALAGDTSAIRKYAAGRALVSDEATERDIANGRPPSYQVVMQDPNGRWSVMSGADATPLRFRFDPAPVLAKRNADAEERRAAILDLQAQNAPFRTGAPAL